MTMLPYVRPHNLSRRTYGHLTAQIWILLTSRS